MQIHPFSSLAHCGITEFSNLSYAIRPSKTPVIAHHHWHVDCLLTKTGSIITPNSQTSWFSAAVVQALNNMHQPIKILWASQGGIKFVNSSRKKLVGFVQVANSDGEDSSEMSKDIDWISRVRKCRSDANLKDY
jgi:hypothetical protein